MPAAARAEQVRVAPMARPKNELPSCALVVAALRTTEQSANAKSISRPTALRSWTPGFVAG